MEFEELKEKSKVKVLLRGKSGRGKTYNTSKIVIELLKEGVEILYADTESEGATTIVNLVEEDEEVGEEITDNLEYRRVEDYEGITEILDKQGEYDVVVVDSLDHKHSYALKGVTDAKRKSEADWNQYPQIYSAEKEIMEKIGKPEANIIATIDPESGKMDKPKGAQTNVHGYFGVVVDLKKGDDWTSTVANWVGRSDIIGKSPNNLVEGISEEIKDRC